MGTPAYASSANLCSYPKRHAMPYGKGADKTEQGLIWFCLVTLASLATALILINTISTIIKQHLT